MEGVILVLPSVSVGLSGVFVLLGVWAIKIKKDIKLHRFFMTSAFILSFIFISSYILRHFMFGVKRYEGDFRNLYVVILSFHTFCATLNLPLSIYTIFLAFRRNFARHKKVAKITAPLWIITAITGWIVFFFLYL
ncbi:hypothetical protein HRbin19_01633 [bacterium HR19]|nr:hypothetical protein HRbin19_01633 [bacterium HR19]